MYKTRVFFVMNEGMVNNEKKKKKKQEQKWCDVPDDVNTEYRGY